MRTIGSIALISALLAGCPQKVPVGTAGAGLRSANKTVGLKVDPNLRPGMGPVVAEIGEMKLTIGDLENRLNRRGAHERMQFQNLDKRKELLTREVQFELLAQEAVAAGVDKDPELQYQFKKMMVQQLTRGKLESRAAENVTEEDLRAYYEKHEAEYSNPLLYRSSIIRIAHGQDKAAAAKKAEEARKFAANAKANEDPRHFRKLVAKYSDHQPSKRLGGDLKFLSADEFLSQYGPAMKNALWALEKDSISKVVEGTDDAFYIIKKTGERPPRTRTFDDMKNQLTNLLRREKREKNFEAYVDSLDKKFGVTLHPEELKTMKINIDAIPPHASEHGMVGGGHDHGHGAPEIAVP